MGRNFNILNELEDIHAVHLIQAGRENHFFVPENYFNELPDAILANIFLHSIDSSNPFTVPKAYFETFATVVLNRIKGNDISNVFENKGQLYSVPENYFENFADEILKKIKKESQTTVQEELTELSPFLGSIPKTNVYSVPENYFEDLSKGIPSLSPAKVIPITSRTKRWANYAAAACVAALLFGINFLHFYKKGSIERPAVAASMSNEDLQKQLSVLSDEEITNYLKNNTNLAVYTNTGSDEYQQQNIDVQNMLQNVSDEEIQQYLDEHPESSSTGSTGGEGI
jgi:hypothetical protein